MTITLDITAEMIEASVKDIRAAREKANILICSRADICPVAKALKVVTGKTLSVVHTDRKLLVMEGDRAVGRLTGEAEEFVDRFDDTPLSKVVGTILPSSFTVEVDDLVSG